MKVSVPISEAPIFQKTDTGKKLSPYKTYDREKKKILEQQKGSRKGNSVLTYLAEYKTHMTASIYSVTPVTPVKDQISECYMCGKKITQILMLSTVDYEGKMQSLGKGQAAGIPAMVYASDLYAVNTALETNPLPQSVLIDVSNTNSISGQLDELDKLIRHNIPIICITDTMNSFELDMLKTRGFDIWRWDDSRWNKKAESDIKEAIDIWVDLDYNKHGEGGLFPIAEPYDDLREVDMWVQASWWYEWNFG